VEEIKSDEEHAKVMKRLHELWDALPDTLEFEELQEVVNKIEDYEQKRWPIEPPPSGVTSETDCDDPDHSSS